MAKLLDSQTNLWGKNSGPDIQRSDLWIIDFTQALNGISLALGTVRQMSSGALAPYVPATWGSYFAKAVTLPELKTRSEPIRRDSRPFQMPSWDEPVDGVRMVFWLDCYTPGTGTTNPYRSDIYQMLEAWRTLVRAGRGSMSSEYAVTLNGNYSIDYAFNVLVKMKRGSSNPTSTGAVQFVQPNQPTANSGVSSSIVNDLELSLQLTLVNCWLGSYQVSELDYEGSRIVQLNTVFYAEDIKQN
jgi:hypothetical protein